AKLPVALRGGRKGRRIPWGNPEEGQTGDGADQEQMAEAATEQSRARGDRHGFFVRKNTQKHVPAGRGAASGAGRPARVARLDPPARADRAPSGLDDAESALRR